MFAKKSLGQNFLMHRQTAARIVAAARLPEGATVLEIGPGTGMLTRELLAKAGNVIAVEADGALVHALEAAFASEIGDGRLTIIHGDVRSFDIRDHLTGLQDRPAARRGESGERNVLTYGERVAEAPQRSSRDGLGVPYHLVANIPYYITGEIIRQFLTARRQPASMTLLVQKEVAVRIAREKKESLLSLSVKAFGQPEYCFTVPRGAFKPAPNVDSAVLRVGDISRSSFASPEEEARFFRILRAGFAHKRKRLAKNLAEVAGPEEIRQAFMDAGIGPDARAEDLPLAAWIALAQTMKSEPD